MAIDEQNKEIVRPASPPPNVPDGGIGNASKTKRDHSAELIRRFAVEQAVKSLEYKNPNLYPALGDTIVDIASKIEKFITDGKVDSKKAPDA